MRFPPKYLSRSLAEAELPQAYLVRGRASMKASKLHFALDDFTWADKLKPTGQTLGCSGILLRRAGTSPQGGRLLQEGY
jgi:hypothetical protein